MTTNQSLIDFPCDFPVKIIGKNNAIFTQQIQTVINKHAPDFDGSNLKKQLSENQNYLSMTVTIHVLNQAMLDAFYEDVTSQSEVRMVL